MKLYTHGFWKGFLEKTDPVHVGFFIDLFEKVFNESIELVENLEQADILLESLFITNTLLFKKIYKYTFLFSGESRLNIYSDHYNCVLCSDFNNENRINVPLFIPNIYCNNLIERFGKITKEKTKDICCIISNCSSSERTYYLDTLDKYFSIDYYGDYKNNKPKISDIYNSEGFIDIISDYRFVITMENSRNNLTSPNYITEKILQGFLSSSIPIYWGSTHVTEYFNPNRFINIEEMNEQNIKSSIIKIKELLNYPEAYNKMVNQNIFINNKLSRNIETIALDIRMLLLKNKLLFI